jgi:hypothetical protein
MLQPMLGIVSNKAHDGTIDQVLHESVLEAYRCLFAAIKTITTVPPNHRLATAAGLGSFRPGVILASVRCEIVMTSGGVQCCNFFRILGRAKVAE